VAISEMVPLFLISGNVRYYQLSRRVISEFICFRRKIIDPDRQTSNDSVEKGKFLLPTLRAL
jgi:hypothetical protein